MYAVMFTDMHNKQKISALAWKFYYKYKFTQKLRHMK